MATKSAAFSFDMEEKTDSSSPSSGRNKPLKALGSNTPTLPPVSQNKGRKVGRAMIPSINLGSESPFAAKPAPAYRKRSFSARLPALSGLSLDVDNINNTSTCDTSYQHTSQSFTQICSPITETIYLGGSQIAQNETGITHIINCASSIVPSSFPDRFKYLNLPLCDNHTQDITGYFYHAFNFIDDAVSSNGKVLIHCEKGVSRSPSLLIAYLSVSGNLSYEEAEDKIKSIRKCIDPNLEFVLQLKTWINTRPHDIQSLDHPVIYKITMINNSNSIGSNSSNNNSSSIGGGGGININNNNCNNNYNTIMPLIQGPLLGYTPEMLLSVLPSNYNNNNNNNLHINNNTSPLISHSPSSSSPLVSNTSAAGCSSSPSYLSPRSSDVYLICKSGQNYCYTSMSNRNICRSYVEKAIQYLAKYENGSLTCEYITPNENINFK